MKGRHKTWGARTTGSCSISTWVQCEVKWKSLSCVQLFATPVNYTVHGILQARILGWVAFPFFRGSSQCRDWTQVSHIAGGFFTSWTTREALGYNGFIQLSVFLSRNTYHLEIKWLFSFLHRFLHFAMYECIQTFFSFFTIANTHNIKFPILKCTLRWYLAHS